MPKRRRDDIDFLPCKRTHLETLLTKRKNEATDDICQKRQRMENCVVDDLRKRNFQLEQTVQALCHKINTLEYMLKMFQHNETVGNNRLVHAY